VGPTSDAICRTAPGGVLGVRGPFGSCWPTPNAVGKDVVIVAGGIGLAPLRPVVYEVLGARERASAAPAAASQASRQSQRPTPPRTP